MAGSGRPSARSRAKPATNVKEGEDSLRYKKPDLKARKGTSSAHGFIRIFDVNLKVVLVLSVFACLVILFLIRHLVNPAEEARRPRVVTPFPAPKLMDLPQVKWDFFLLLFLFLVLLFTFFGIISSSRMDELVIAVSRRAPRELVLGNLSPSCVPRNSCEVCRRYCENICFTKFLL